MLGSEGFLCGPVPCHPRPWGSHPPGGEEPSVRVQAPRGDGPGPRAQAPSGAQGDDLLIGFANPAIIAVEINSLLIWEIISMASDKERVLGVNGRLSFHSRI